MRIPAALALCVSCASVPPPITVRIGPAGADTRDDLVATVEGSTAASLRWFVDDEEVPELTGDRVPASFTARGQVWQVEARVDVDGGSSAATDVQIIENAAPTVVLSMAPQEPQSSDALVVAALARDADADELTVRYRWWRDEVFVPNLVGDRVDADQIRRGERWKVEVVATDGVDQSTPATAEVLVSNGGPVVVDGGVSPQSPRADQAITGWVSVEDPDGDTATIRWDWYVGEERVQTSESPRLEPGPYQRGDTVRAVVVATDGLGKAEPTIIGDVVVRNAPPLAPSVVLSPTEPLAGEALRCAPAATPADLDGDAITGWQFAWTRDGATFSGATTTSLPGDTIPAGTSGGDEDWVCAIRASDGTDWSGWGSAAVTTEEAGFAPTMVVAGRTVTCGKVTNDAVSTTCEDLTINGKAFPNGLSCGLGWSASASPWTDHADFCQQITGNTTFQAYYQCNTTQDRITWVAGAWGSRTDNGYTRSLECYW